jgi:hypothetical protein
MLKLPPNRVNFMRYFLIDFVIAEDATMSVRARQAIMLFLLALSLSACANGSSVASPVPTDVAPKGIPESATVFAARTALPDASPSSSADLPTPTMTNPPGIAQPPGDARPFVIQFLQAVRNKEDLSSFLSPASGIPRQGYDLASMLNLPAPITAAMVRCQAIGVLQDGRPILGVYASVTTSGGDATIVVEMASRQPPWQVMAVNRQGNSPIPIPGGAC